MSRIIQWTDPPRSVEDEVAEVVAELRDRPFEWALVLDGVYEHTADEWHDHLSRHGEVAVRIHDPGNFGDNLSLYARSTRAPR